MGRKSEKWHPLVLGTISAVVSFGALARYQWHLPQSVGNLFPAVINVSAIAIGFLGAAQSILVSIEHRKTFLQLKDAGVFDRIVGYVLWAVNCSFALAGLSALGLMIDVSKPRWYIGTGMS